MKVGCELFHCIAVCCKDVSAYTKMVFPQIQTKVEYMAIPHFFSDNFSLWKATDYFPKTMFARCSDIATGGL